ncbi:MAG TPA: carbon-nitrogen hydrolase family protein [Thermoanaerobaculia bacterium]|nr:carbon-nitrogen hydrolase family protein [Thermoanaerobaculia bacterium]
MKIAAYQAPLPGPDSSDSIALIRAQITRCEREGVDILCCPEAILGGLADQSTHPHLIAVAADDLVSKLAPLASATVTTIVGFTELANRGHLYNSAAVFHRGSILGVYRKLYPAIRRSVYQAGDEVPVFQVGALRFGIVICNDSNYAEPARRMATQGATVLFVPTNNALASARGGAELVDQARNVDIARAVENRLWVVRSDVAGRTGELTSYGSSEIVSRDGGVVHAARSLREDLLIVEIDPLIS